MERAEIMENEVRACRTVYNVRRSGYKGLTLPQETGACHACILIEPVTSRYDFRNIWMCPNVCTVEDALRTLGYLARTAVLQLG